MSAEGGPNIVYNGLVLYLDAANIGSYVSGSTLWYDLSGNNNTGTLTNGPTFNSGNGGSIVFDGVDDYVSFANSSTFNFGTSDFSVSIWFNITGNSIKNNNNVRDACLFSIIADLITTTAYFSIIVQGDANNTGTGIQIYQNAPSTTNITYTYSISQNNWHNISIVKSSNIIYIYFDSSLIYQTNNTSSWGNSSNISKIAQLWNTGYVDDLNGKVSTLQIYNRALTTTEILQNFNAQRSRFNL